MNGPVSLVIALVSYGNAYLASSKTNQILDFNNSTLIYNYALIFNDDASSLKINIIANSPEEWFKYLKNNGCKKLKIYYRHSEQSKSKDFENAGFVGGGGDWIIETVYNTHSDYWGFTQDAIESNALKARIWKTHFFIIKHNPANKEVLPINVAKHNLSVSLTNITAFAIKQNRYGWVKNFDRASETLSSPNPKVDYYKDFIVPNTLSLQSRQLLFSATSADVFGGMGSWNDIWYNNEEINELYIKLSAELFDKMNEAVVSALNN